MSVMYNRHIFCLNLEFVAEYYEKTAPTVEAWCDWLASAKDDKITIADLSLLDRLWRETPPANLAANLVYHRMQAAGLDTTGQTSF